jgi:DNA excision repair protein ERCC-3
MRWRASPNWRRARSTSIPTASPPSRCGTPPPLGWMRHPSLVASSASANTSCRATCARISSTRSHATGGSSWSRRASTCCSVSDARTLLVEIERNKHIAPCLIGWHLSGGLLVDPAQRGRIKQALLQFGYPAEDLAGYVSGAPLELALHPTTLGGRSFTLRDYQTEAVDVFHAGGTSRGGSGVIVLPCGAGKTVVGLGVLARLQCHTFILTPSMVASRQWIHEILDKTSVPAEVIGEYSGERKKVRPITVTTYQVLTYRPSHFPHFALFNEHDWGLIVYDEVHLLPAPVFRITAEIQARRRLGLTATLIREDGRQTDVFSLIGPKKQDVPWKDLERQGWIATATCHEVRVRLPEDQRMAFALADETEKDRVAAVNPAKLAVLERLVAEHAEDQVLIIGQYLDQLHRVAERFGAPLLSGCHGRRQPVARAHAHRARERVLAKRRRVSLSPRTDILARGGT